MMKFVSMLESWRLTVVSGVALAVSLVFRLMDYCPTVVVGPCSLALDPALVSVFISGVPLLYWALRMLILMRRITSALLITMAMVACLYIGELFAAGEVAFIMALGGLLEMYTVQRAKRGITQLVSLVPDTARRIESDGSLTTVAVGDVAVGDVVRVLPGERVSVDGVVISGATSVDQSVMTGESLPVDKAVGDTMFCGTMNCHGSVDIQATAVVADTSLQKMIALVRDAEQHKAPTQRIVDRWAQWLVPIALAIAVVTYLVVNAAGVPDALDRAVTVLVVFCPCALALATPVSVVAGIGQATRHGVLVKSGEALEMMGRCNCVAFDKTGTLTVGRLTVAEVLPLDSSLTADDLLRLTASVEAHSEHPIGRAVVRHYDGRLLDVDNFAMLPGKGVQGVVKLQAEVKDDQTADGVAVVCGTAAYLEACGVKGIGEALTALQTVQAEGKAAVLTAVDGRCAGIIVLGDSLRPTAASVAAELRAMGVETVMLTGDNSRVATALAQQAGRDSERAELLPADKVTAISDLQTSGRMVCMVGDGVNDAPALKMATVGVAMGGMGSDIAVEAADIALMGDDIAQLPYLKRLSHAVIRSIKVNITLSMLINTVAITLSVLGLMGPMCGALVHNAGSVLVVLNAALLYDRKI